MYRATSPQVSFYEPIQLVPGCLPQDDWSYIFKTKIWPQIDEEKFKDLYQQAKGAPNRSIKQKIAILMFMGMERLNWREAEFQYTRRIDWLNATCASFGDKPPDHTTLFKFFNQLKETTKAYQLFSEITNLFIKECNVSTAKQRTDSFFMVGWLEILSRYGLFRETIRCFLLTLKKRQREAYEQIKGELDRDYLQEEFDLTEKDKEKANRQIKTMARDLYSLKEAFKDHSQLKTCEAYQTLVTVFEQQCVLKDSETQSLVEVELKPDEDKTQIVTEARSVDSGLPETKDGIQQVELDNPPAKREEQDSDLALPATEEKVDSPVIEIREKPLGEKIISTPYNKDAEYTRKGKQKVVGHKAFVTETCDPENKVQFITDINLEAAGHSDAAELEKINQRLDENQRKPEELLADAGFVNGETILQSETRKIELVGPSSGRSQSFDKYREKDRPLDVADFDIEINQDTKELEIKACPLKQVPKDQARSPKTGKIVAHFDLNICASCTLKELCPVKIGVTTATFNVDEKQYTGALRHQHYMSDPGYRKRCALRAGAESLVNEMANAHGARKSKHKNESASKIQLIFSALSCNVKRFINYSRNAAQTQIQPA